MELTSSLKEAGYDLIDSPVRNHKLTQLWLKKDFDKIQMYYDQLQYAFTSTVDLPVFTNTALKVTSSERNEFNFNIGITILDDILKSIGLSNFDISAEIKSGKSVTVSYNNSITKEIEIGALEHYLSNFDFLHPNNVLLKNLNQNDVIIITGILYAKNLNIEIDTDYTISADLKAKLTEIAGGKLDFSKSSEKTIKMTADTGDYYPIAVKANRLDFDHGKFKKHFLITDNRNLF
ncbi:gasdermin [Flavobacterium adhaerens]|uniref:gasdermin n=1 Tax=Flavobacterium adhaerens TaxID=3149043 RepID=UPI0032B4453B